MAYSALDINTLIIDIAMLDALDADVVLVLDQTQRSALYELMLDHNIDPYDYQQGSQYIDLDGSIVCEVWRA